MKVYTPGTDPPQYEESGPRSRRKAWAEHIRWVKEQIESQPDKAGFLEMMLARQREDYEVGRFPWQHPLEGRPTDEEITKAIAECIAESERPRIGRDELWRLVQSRFPGEDIPRKLVAALMPKHGRGRPRKA
jgi:hypothetical protein